MEHDWSGKSQTHCNYLFSGYPLKGKWKQELLIELGILLEVAAKDHRRQAINIASFLYWMKPAILHNQYLLINHEGAIDPSGYVAWAWVSDRTLIRYMTEPQFNLHPMNWNEGNNLIIVDFICLEPCNSQKVLLGLFRRARKHVGIKYHKINICIRNTHGVVIRHNKRGYYV